MFERFPNPGDSFKYKDLTVTVLDMDKQRVDKVLVRRMEPDAHEE